MLEYEVILECLKRLEMNISNLTLYSLVMYAIQRSLYHKM